MNSNLLNYKEPINQKRSKKSIISTFRFYQQMINYRFRKGKKDKTKTIPTPPQLTQTDEQRIEAILAAADEYNETYNYPDTQTDISSVSGDSRYREVRTPFEELEGILDIDLYVNIYF